MDKADTKSASHQLHRPPVVAVLGHVDHGKTSLLDAIRKSNVAAREHGGITQAIGAFTHNHITFIDTPGHEAFSKMRSRGATAADIAILVVASNDGVMPQTKEALSHAKAANVPIVVALTKSDLPEANVEKVKQQLIKEGLSLEGLGGDTPVVSVSSKTGKGISDLLEVILLVAQMHNITSDPAGSFEGIVIEAKHDRRKGALATVIVKRGILSVGDTIFAENVSGKVRALLSDTGANVKQAGPGMPVEILGFSKVPAVGAKATKSAQEAAIPVTTKNGPQAAQPDTKRLAIILKTDTQGSREAIMASLPLDDIILILAASGDPTEADVLLAKASSAIIVGFNTGVSSSVAKLAEIEGVIVKTFRLIYELTEELADVIALFKQGKPQEMILGRAVVQAVFPYEKKKVAGSKVVEGRIAKGDKVRVERDGEPIGEARVTSLRKGKEDTGKVEMGSECGILLSSSLDFEPSDVILSVR